MQPSDSIRSRKRRCNRCVIGGATLMVMALIVSSENLTSPVTTTVAAIVGFVLLVYGVHIGWLVFYERESDGPAS